MEEEEGEGSAINRRGYQDSTNSSSTYSWTVLYSTEYCCAVVYWTKLHCAAFEWATTTVLYCVALYSTVRDCRQHNKRSIED